MVEEEAPAPAAAPAKSPAKASRTKAADRRKKAGPTLRDLIVEVVSDCKDRSGMSLAAMKKALIAKDYDVENNNSRVNVAVKALVANETLLQIKGSGASGSFKLNKKVEPKAKKPVKKAAASKAKPSTPKKTVAAKKPKAVAKKPAAAKKTPTKAKKPVTAKKAAKSPKKNPKKVVKKAAPAAKKAPAKKAAAKPKAKKTAAKKK